MSSSTICSGLRIAYLVCPDCFQDSIYNALCNVNIKTSALDAEVVCQLVEAGVAGSIANEKMAKAQKAHRVVDSLFFIGA